jgi:hypothetical protein
MLRYWLFSNNKLHSLGGMLDFIKSFSKLEFAKTYIHTCIKYKNYNWYQLYDSIEQKTIIYKIKNK